MRKRKSPMKTKTELPARVNVLLVKNMSEKPVSITMKEMT
jgi:hypothetical protein